MTIQAAYPLAAAMLALLPAAASSENRSAADIDETNATVVAEANLVGSHLAAGDGAAWRIDRVEDDPNSEGQLYVVSVIDGAGSRPLCPGEDGEALSALPLEGSWNDAGDWRAEGMTLACYDGVLAKCVRWGYTPWGEHRGQSLRDYHQACTRMARADYCGDDVAHTENGTLIDLWDKLGIQHPENGVDLAFEAAWTPDGAFNIERTRYPDEMAYVVEHCPERLAGGSSEGDALFWNLSIPR